MMDYGSLLVAENCASMGQIFGWNLRLREVLHINDELYVLDKPLEECPNISASYDEYMEWF